LIGAGGFDGNPPLHTSFVHWLPSFGTSPFATISTISPPPSQALTRQSPAVCSEVGVPNGVKLKPHVDAEQLR
jgi:hypothetical protein